MVRLTGALLKYIPEWYHLQKTGSSYFKKQNLFFMTRFYRNIGWATHKNAMNRFHYFLNGEMFFAKQNSLKRLDHNRARIAAAAEEHGVQYHHLVSTLRKIDIHLDSSALARLAVYEPKTFRSLVGISRAATAKQLGPANFNEQRLLLKEEL